MRFGMVAVMGTAGLASGQLAGSGVFPDVAVRSDRSWTATGKFRKSW